MKKKLFPAFIATLIGIAAIAQSTANLQVKDLKVNPKVANSLPGTLTKTITAKAKMCIDKIYESGISTSTGSGSTRAGIEGLAGETKYFWPNGSTIRVKFLGGSPIVRLKTIRYATEWSNYANIRFRFVEDNNADIKVRFNNDGTSWSMLGTSVKEYEALIRLGEAFAGDIATMNFGWLTDDSPDEEFSRVVLHEFGHALGFIHEHSQPGAQIPWDREAAYAYYAAPPNNWDRARVDAQVFRRYERSQTVFTNYDPTSIMQYSVSNALTIGDFEIPLNRTLSQADKDFAAMIYPKAGTITNKLKVTFKTGGDDLRVNSQAKILLTLNSGAVTSLEVSANRSQGYGNGSTNSAEINLPAGINLANVTRCRLYFESGKQFETDSQDNWNIDEVKLEWLETRRPNVLLSTVVGTPLIRMTDKSELLLFPR